MVESPPPLWKRGVLRAAWDYVHQMYGNQAASGFWLIRGLWSAGPVGRAGLLLLGGALPLAAALLSGVLAFVWLTLCL